MPAAAAALSYFAGLRPQGKAAVAFGSYGWGPGGPKGRPARPPVASLGTPSASVRAQYRPTAAVLAECRHAGEQLAETAKGKAEGGGRRAEG